MKKVTEKIRKTILILYANRKLYGALFRLTGASKSKIKQILTNAGVSKKIILSGQPKKLSERRETEPVRKFQNKELSFATDGVKWIYKNFKIKVLYQTVRGILKSTV